MDDTHSRSSLAFWTDASRELRRLTAVMWATGALLVAVGWWLDVRGWWEHRPFLTNLASALTGAFFALPVAVLVIENIRRRESSRFINLQARRTLEDLRETALALTYGFRRTVLDQDFWWRLQDLLENCSQCYKNLEEVNAIGKGAADLHESQTSLARFKRILVGLKENLIKLETFLAATEEYAATAERYYGDRRSVRDFLTRLTRDWEFFVKQALRRLEESRLPLPGDAKVMELKALMDKIKNSAEDPWTADSLLGFYPRHRVKVQQLVEQVESVLALPDAVINPGRPARDRSLEGFLESVKRSRERQATRNWEELQKRQESLKAVKRFVSELCDTVNQVKDFATTVDAVVRKLSDMEREWIGSSDG